MTGFAGLDLAGPEVELTNGSLFSRALARGTAVQAGHNKVSHCYLVIAAKTQDGARSLLAVSYRSASKRALRDAEQRAKSISALVGLAFSSLDSSREDLAEKHGRSLMNLALELKPSLRLPEFVGRFTCRAGEILGARVAILALTRGAQLETVLVSDLREPSREIDRPRLNAAITKLAQEHSEGTLLGSAMALLGEEAALSFGWHDVCFVRLTGTEGDLLGALCLVDRAKELAKSDRNLVQALAGHASVALENSRLFSRIEHSKRQWVEDFDAISDLIVVHDPVNMILRVNRSLADAVGLRPSELVGKSTKAISKIAADSPGLACPFCRESDHAIEESVLTSGARAFLISTSRIGSGEEGSRTIHVLKDITEQRRYQTQLQRERDFNTKILNNTQSMILVLDTAGLVSYANRRCYESGYGKEDLLGRTFAEFIPRNRRAQFDRTFASALRGIASENIELPVLRGNRSTGQFSISVSPMRDEEGHVNSIVVVLTDITDAAVLQAQLRHSEKMAAVGQLVAGVAHEINNPLAAIVGYSDLLLENSSVPKSAKEELEIVLKEAERTKEIVQNLLRFARQMPAKREVLDIHDVLRQVLQLRTYGGASDGVEVVEHFSTKVPQVFGDANQLQQVFLNILNNAYDAVRESGCTGRIEIATKELDGVVEITIRDNGVGISDTARIFEPFYTTKEVGKGTGLGLSICYGIVREHGGDVICENNNNGAGCTFFVRLPAAKTPATFSVAGMP
ncbi:MAG TPA: ATP-binding protein [Candidatus Acidoferrales bacterium]|nr:ATP-binding protein [Candidatus Acidoferrales bacterium]